MELIKDNAEFTQPQNLMYHEFTISRDIFSFLSLYGILPVYEKTRDKSDRLKVFRSKEDIQCTVYSADDVCDFINTLTKRETVEVFNTDMPLGTWYNVRIITNSQKVISRFVKGLSYNTEFKIDADMKIYTAMHGETRIFKNDKYFRTDSDVDNKCIVSICYNTSEASYGAKIVNLTYDEEKDVFIEAINMWVDCMYAKPFKGVKLIRVDLESKDNDICARCKAVFDDKDAFINLVKGIKTNDCSYSITLSKVAQAEYESLTKPKKEVQEISKDRPKESPEISTPTQPVADNSDTIEITAPSSGYTSPTIADGYGRKVYRQTSGGYHNDK